MKDVDVVSGFVRRRGAVLGSQRDGIGALYDGAVTDGLEFFDSSGLIDVELIKDILK